MVTKTTLEAGQLIGSGKDPVASWVEVEAENAAPSA